MKNKARTIWYRPKVAPWAGLWVRLNLLDN
jgi:hypothetical protein